LPAYSWPSIALISLFTIIFLGIGVELIHQSSPRIRPVDADPAHLLVPIFAIENPSPIVMMRDVHWSCVLEAVGTNTRLNFSGVQGRVEIAPRSSIDRRCFTMSVRSEGVVALHVTVRFKTLFFGRTVAASPFFWQVEDGRGKWVKPEDIPTPLHPSDGHIILGNP
jgi:hypothetical protein